MTAGEIIQEGAAIQDKSKAAVDRMKRQIEESKQVGAETAAKLKGQTEQLKNIDQDIMKVKSNLKRADLLLRAFMRKIISVSSSSSKSVLKLEQPQRTTPVAVASISAETTARFMMFPLLVHSSQILGAWSF